MFTVEEKKEIHQAIKTFEDACPAEFHLVVVKKAKKDIYKVAVDTFHHMKLHEREHRRCVLLFIAERSKRFALLGDEIIHQDLGNNHWNILRDKIITNFKQGDFVQGVLSSIDYLSHQLKEVQ